MVRSKLDPEILAHLEWIGFVRPTGLVVSAPALVRAGAILDRRDAEGQRLLMACTEERTFDPKDGPVAYLPDFRAFAESVLGWSFAPTGYAGTPESPIPPELEVPLPEYGETLRPDFAVRELDPREGDKPWQLLVRVLDAGDDFDNVVRGIGLLETSEHGRMERLLRQTGVAAGVLFNGRTIRVLSAPRGESSGWLDLRLGDMLQVAGRPISTAMRLLLGQSRLLSLPRAQRFAALLDDSRKFQNEVSERLAQQVLHALYELLRGFQAADDASKGVLLRQPMTDRPDEVYRSLLTVILRLVFLLYAEEREMLPGDDTFLRYYSLLGLYERLREDAALFPDTMDQRYGAWAQLTVLFRMVNDGAQAGAMHLPARHGVLFDPDRFPFLEGRAAGPGDGVGRVESPLVPDGTIWRALHKLLVLDGERISYRALDVEQIGSVYETMMGFRLETATGRSVAIKAQKKHGAPTTVDLEVLLSESPAKREKWVQDHADRKLSDSVRKLVAAASTVGDVHAALQPVIDLAATPDLVQRGAMVLQPSEERRRSGSHYTPRALTQPIVSTTLEPILGRLRGLGGQPPRPEQILDLKVCDPAMGSGAFLVEACRQLGDALVEAWQAHGEVPVIPVDEDEFIFARRLIAQRCLYGVDRNPVAVDLAKVSLWLATLAKDHSLTFVDHALRHGDSLVGLSRQQIEAFHWVSDAPPFQAGFETMQVRRHVARVSTLRQDIREADEALADREQRERWNVAQAELGEVRLFGDLVLAAFFEGDKPKDRERKRSEYAGAVLNGVAAAYAPWLEEWRHAERALAPFHWEIEFPEVFERAKHGFDAIVGNPPFMGGKDISGALGPRYLDWLHDVRADARGQADLAAFFFRAAYDLLGTTGTLGLLATNTIRQGDTRAAGLRSICESQGVIYSAERRIPWQGSASVVTSAIHIAKGFAPGITRLDGVPVDLITAFLFHQGGNNDPERLLSNRSLAFSGYYYYGAGFTFDDQTMGASPLTKMADILARSPESKIRVHPIIGGQEMLNSPTLETKRFVVDFESMTEREARRWPELFRLLEELVKPERAKCNRERLREFWWQFGETRPGLRAASHGKARLLMHPFTSGHLAFGFIPGSVYVASPHVAIVLTEYSALASLQSRPHEVWARFFGSSLKDDLRYTPSDCFDTFPFPQRWEARTDLEAVGEAYYEFRASLMVRNGEGLTKTYNRFHDPDERDPGILTLRELHAAMDRAVLDAYGWSDLQTDCDFLLDYEIDEEEWGARRKPYRLRWPDEVRDEVLARLLELNAERAKEEIRTGAAVATKRPRKPSAKRGPAEAETAGFFS